MHVADIVAIDKARSASSHTETIKNVLPVSPVSTERRAVTTKNNLFVFPAQCNSTGRRFPLRWIDEVHALSNVDNVCAMASSNASNVDDISTTASCSLNAPSASATRWCVLVDAASYCTTSTFSLRQHPADFLCLSFYKMFGMPTSGGALLVRRDAVPLLVKRGFFGGGTVAALAVDEPWQAFHQDASRRFEDGYVVERRRRSCR